MKSGSGGGSDLKRLTQQEAAYICGITARGFRDWNAPRNADGTYDAQVVHQWRCANLEGSGALDLNAERARLAKAQADKTEQEVDARAGRTLDAGDVEQWVAGMIATAKQRLLQMPDALRQVVPHEHGERVASDARRVVYEALSELAARRDFAPASDDAAVVTAPDPDGQRVGGPVPKTQQRKQRRARPVAD